ncbi:relaxase/mobilization nuclease domain-containing protein [Mucilaginibacter jinjuensis]|uniref:Relaxase/mobilization nuclease domain-containing protein n=1 Tax=Mucilaginibacter jinjuensis TaxID=1176721 RepID=A0ABY7TAX8_9SPHI|nr:relaxase/mobilization nuclease domain-containing protein [Mucilaginibacter jinjuensis]WCT13496.1 relaxase/mobilization nuclease domain-containing protein [Mucilaginibacter jinjuensis]
MIADQKIGKSFMSALGYNLKKNDHPNPKKRAELLDSNFISLDAKQIEAEVELIRQLRPNLNRYVYHTSLNFTKEEEASLTNEKLLAIAHEYLNGMGFTDNQYLIFRHYDADHPHIHLLANRITFDGDVISDSNNYKRSEAILRKLEKQYYLTAVISSNQAAQKAASKDELEMVVRTGKPSQKMVLQELLKNICRQSNLTVPALIKAGEHAGIHFLFNQAVNGRVSGVTYFHDDFKIKGQALGRQFKWTELAKEINYEQVRDSKAISEANSRTRAIYGHLGAAAGTAEPSGRSAGEGSAGLTESHIGDPFHDREQPAGIDRNATAAGADDAGDYQNSDRTWTTDQNADLLDIGTGSHQHHNYFDFGGFEISDDVDDEAIHGRNRHRKKQARTNRR